MKINKYKLAKKLIKNTTVPLSETDKVILLIIAKRADREGTETVTISDDEMCKLVSEGLLNLTISYFRKLFKLIREDHSTNRILSVIDTFHKRFPEKDISEMLEHVKETYFICKKMQTKKLDKLLQIAKDRVLSLH